MVHFYRACIYIQSANILFDTWLAPLFGSFVFFERYYFKLNYHKWVSVWVNVASGNSIGHFGFVLPWMYYIIEFHGSLSLIENYIAICINSHLKIFNCFCKTFKFQSYLASSIESKMINIATTKKNRLKFSTLS